MFIITIYLVSHFIDHQTLLISPSNCSLTLLPLKLSSIENDNKNDCQIQKKKIFALATNHTAISFLFFCTFFFYLAHWFASNIHSLLIFVYECNKFLFRSQNDDENQILRVNAVCWERKKKGPRQKLFFMLTLFSRTLYDTYINSRQSSAFPTTKYWHMLSGRFFFLSIWNRFTNTWKKKSFEESTWV